MTMARTRSPSLDALLAHRAFVRGLAHALVRDPSEADDIEQETWLAALRQPPTGDNVRGWLGSVVRRQAARRARRESRLRDRARKAAPAKTADDPRAVLGRVETTQAAIRAVLALDDPYRTVLLLRYHEGRTPTEIAVTTGVPLETVRTQLRRGLQRVRAKLDARHDSRAQWTALLAFPPGGAGTSTACLTGGLLMAQTSRAFLLTGLLLLGAVGLWLWLGDPLGWRDLDSAASRAAGDETTRIETTATLEGRPTQPDPGPPPTEDVVPASRPIPDGTPYVRLHLQDAATKTPISDAWIWTVAASDVPGLLGTTQTTRGPVFESWPWQAKRAVVWVQTKDRTARFPFERLEPGDHTLLLPPASRLELSFRDDADRERSTNEVRDLLGDALPSVSLLPTSRLTLNPLESALASKLAYRSGASLVEDEDGIQVTPLPTEGTWVLLVESPGRTPWLSDAFRLESGVTTRLDVPLSTAAPTHPFRFVDTATKEPLAFAWLLPYLEWGDDQAFLQVAGLRTDEDGRVALPVHHGQGRLRGRGPTWWLDAPQHVHSVRSSRFPDVGADGVATVEVPRAGHLRGHAYGADGKPAQGQVVMAFRKGRLWTDVVEADGSFALRRLPPGGARVMLIEDVGAMRSQMARARIASAEETSVQIGEPFEQGERGSFTFEARAGDAPYTDLYVILEPRGKGTSPAFQITGAEGRVTFAGLRPGTYDAMVFLGNGRAGDDFTYGTSREGPGIEIEAGQVYETKLTLPGGTLPVRILDAGSGKPVVGAVIMARNTNREPESQGAFDLRAGAAEFSAPGGEATLRGLAPEAVFEIQVRASGYAPWTQSDVPLPREGEVLEIRLEPSAGR